ncbi:hydroxyethylthiazole kinase [Tindallia californiensis]|uniref:Hydroxyethylthiazole kinase n=1 Tax=Tindallia californiensis TaxID=159292 RepID=A0A1H3QG01_9FIRM|nr:hydroxyethylthiazole kinase [Tindallia californiensis]SDZ11945.1 hydroxyethylthiazole kinase [Tindallia californiensis]
MQGFPFTQMMMEATRKKPLIHHITNYVTANDSANTVLAFGGSPVMADEPEEVEEMTSMASALVLNMGTLNKRSIKAMFLAGKKANEQGIPVVLDPVGAGATSLRNETARELLKQINFSFIRGNASEILAITGMESNTRGVDSEERKVSDMQEIAGFLSDKYGTTIGVTGKVDLVMGENQIFELSNGSAELVKVTGTGCMTTSLIALYLGAGSKPVESGILGISIMAIAGELAAENGSQEMPFTSFPLRLKDYLSDFPASFIPEKIKLREVEEKHDTKTWKENDGR